jgi:hypothetical protein
MIALLVSGAVFFGGVGAVSAAQRDLTRPIQSSEAKAPPQAPRNATPLAPGGAAGIKQAQGGGSNDWLLIGGGLLVGVGIIVLVGGGNDDAPSTGTN